MRNHFMSSTTCCVAGEHNCFSISKKQGNRSDPNCGLRRLKVEAEIVVRHGAQEGGREAMPLQPARWLPPPPSTPSTPPSLTVSLRLFGREGAVSSERANANGGLKAKNGEQQSRGKGSKIPSDVRPPGRCQPVSILILEPGFMMRAEGGD